LKLHYGRNPNPRLAVATVRYLNATVEFAFASPFAPGQAAKYTALNPNLSIPILEENGQGLWEADAIACRLSRVMQSNFWRTGDDEPDMIRWISWGKANFVHACDMVHFERGTKQRYAIGPIDPVKVKEGLENFDLSADILNTHLASRHWLLGDIPSYADFRMATFLPFNDVAKLPLDKFPFVKRWYDRLTTIEAWRDPFDGLDTPVLPPIPA
jgi:glutathione S-transferase